jgi:cation-transporting ATPase 13A2
VIQANDLKTAYSDVAIFPMKELEYPYPVFTAFRVDSSSVSSRRPSVISKTNTSSQAEDEEVLEKLTVVDYRYSRFALDPRTGLFSSVR